MEPQSRLAESILAGRYQAGDTPLHALSPGRKMGLTLLFVMLASTGRFEVLGGLSLCVAIAWGLARIPLMFFWRLVRSFRWFLIILTGLPLFFTPGEPLFSGFDAVTREGLAHGVQASWKLMVMFLVSFLLIRTTPPMALMHTVEGGVRFLSPGLRDRARALFQVGLWAIQLIPVLCLEAERFMISKLNDGAEPGTKTGGFRKAWRVAQLLAPLVVHVLREKDRFAALLATRP